MHWTFCFHLLLYWIVNVTVLSQISIGSKRLNIQFNNATFMDEISKEAITKMHDELDTDEDGNVSMDEGAMFLANQKIKGSEKNANLAGFKTDIDGRISEQEFWDSWIQSEAHNWTNADILSWLKYDVELPQYSSMFHTLNVTGSAFPVIAWNGSIVTAMVEGSKENKLKLMLMAKQVVLFGPAKPKANFFKDALLTISILLALSGIFYGVHVKRDANRTIEDIEEKMRLLQSSIDTMDEENEIDKIWAREVPSMADDDRSGGSNSGDSMDSMPAISVIEEELTNSKLAEVMRELDSTKESLRNAQRELERKAYEMPPGLYDCLKATYDVESKLFEMKRKRVQEDLEMTKSQFQKIEKNRSTLLGILQVVHSRQMDRFDSKVQQTREEFVELQSIMKERKKRWTTIESICKFRIKPNSRGLGMPRSMATPEEDILSSLDTMSITSVAASTSVIHRHRKSKRPSVCTVLDDQELDTVSMKNFSSTAPRKSPLSSRKHQSLPSNVSAPTALSSYANGKKQNNGDPLPTVRETKTIIHSQSTKDFGSHLPIPETGNQTFPKRSPVAKRRSQLPDFSKEKTLSSSNPSVATTSIASPSTTSGEFATQETSLTPSKRSSSVRSLPSVEKNNLDPSTSPKQHSTTPEAVESLDINSVSTVSSNGVDKGRKTNFIKRTFFQRKNKEKTSK